MADTRTQHRSIVERWVITGTLRLETPAHFGNGDADPLTDMPLFFDEVSGSPLLPGTSIAGALRNYLRELQLGYGLPEKQDSLACLLFGGSRSSDEGVQSALIVNDAPGHATGIELRDGVAIDSETRTAEDKKKFDFQLLSAGSTFELRFELLVGENSGSQALRDILATALHGLEKGQITLGARKRRGFGQCRVENWQVWKYHLADKNQLLAWLASERGWKTSYQIAPAAGQPIESLLDAALYQADKRSQAHLKSTFSLDGTLMIRSGFGETDSGPDMVHLHSPRPGKTERAAVIPGTSWAGVLRHRALKIARTLSNNSQAHDKEGKPRTKKDEIPLLNAEVFVNSMFGPSEIKGGEKDVRASRVSIQETEIQEAEALVITRVKIDRFTGGALESALFSEQPAVGKDETRVTLDLDLRCPTAAETGLILLLLKDLWTGNLLIGGESGVGRGQLKGISAALSYDGLEWTFNAVDEHGGVAIVQSKGENKNVQDFVTAFNTAMTTGGTE
jgi:CRISPR/Cas system CSM-associated protein Csm3 (group 7 of RAMP superfamily)